MITKVRTSEEETEQNRLSQKEKKSHDSLDEGFKQLLWMALRGTGLYLTTDHGPLVKKVVCLF